MSFFDWAQQVVTLRDKLRTVEENLEAETIRAEMAEEGEENAKRKLSRVTAQRERASSRLKDAEAETVNQNALHDTNSSQEAGAAVEILRAEVERVEKENKILLRAKRGWEEEKRISDKRLTQLEATNEQLESEKLKLQNTNSSLSKQVLELTEAAREKDQQASVMKGKLDNLEEANKQLRESQGSQKQAPFGPKEANNSPLSYASVVSAAEKTAVKSLVPRPVGKPRRACRGVVRGLFIGINYHGLGIGRGELQVLYARPCPPLLSFSKPVSTFHMLRRDALTTQQQSCEH